MHVLWKRCGQLSKLLTHSQACLLRDQKLQASGQRHACAWQVFSAAAV
jgi:hypothetical protein